MSSPDHQEHKPTVQYEEIRSAIVGAWEKEDHFFFSKQTKQLVSTGFPMAQAIPLSVLRWLEDTSISLTKGRPLRVWLVEDLYGIPEEQRDIRKIATLGLVFGFFVPFGFTESVAQMKTSEATTDQFLMAAFQNLDREASRLRSQKPKIYQKGREFFREKLSDRIETYMNLSLDINTAKGTLMEDPSGLGIVSIVFDDFLEKARQINPKLKTYQMDGFSFMINPGIIMDPNVRDNPILLGATLAINLYGRIYGNGFASKEELEEIDR